MKLSLNELMGYRIETLDGIQGTIKDFLLDEDYWVVRHVDVDLGLFSAGRRVLIPRLLLGTTDWTTKHFKVQLHKSDLEGCPELRDNLPISRQYEQELNKSYKLKDYWGRDYYPPKTKSAVTKNHTLPPEPVRVSFNIIREEDLDSTLRSFKELIGYNVKTKEGNLGVLHDLLIDSESWSVISAIVSQIPPHSKERKVLIATTFIKEISYVNKSIMINLSVADVISAPDFDALEPINEKYVKKSYDSNGKPI